MTPSSPTQLGPATTPVPRCLLVVVEGVYDIHFLQSISALLHAHQPHLPDLHRLEQEGRVLFLPIGVGNLQEWTQRLASLGQPEFHLYDREVPPLTDQRQQAVAAVNRRPGCVAVLTGLRALENYLHPETIREARGVEVVFEDHSDLPELLARKLWETHSGPAWDDLPWRARRRLRHHAKKILNHAAVQRMTPERLRERDPSGEVIGWLTTMARMVAGLDPRPLPLVAPPGSEGPGS
jgi:putative ATP-dependent endonuclease of OLD family